MTTEFKKDEIVEVQVKDPQPGGYAWVRASYISKTPKGLHSVRMHGTGNRRAFPNPYIRKI